MSVYPHTRAQQQHGWGEDTGTPSFLMSKPPLGYDGCLSQPSIALSFFVSFTCSLIHCGLHGENDEKCQVWLLQRFLLIFWSIALKVNSLRAGQKYTHKLISMTILQIQSSPNSCTSSGSTFFIIRASFHKNCRNLVIAVLFVFKLVLQIVLFCTIVLAEEKMVWYF